MNQTFLPVCKEDMEERGWEQLDFLFISGDAYVDHPSFAPAVICRVLEAAGYKVAILPQPDWNSAARKPRKEDKYSPGKEMGKRPDHATLVYAKAAKKLWPDLPVIIGGIEASLRRFAHYDYWEDKLLPSILTESGADLLVCGMGETQIREIADYLAGGASGEDLHYIRGTAYAAEALDNLEEYVELPAYDAIRNDKRLLADAYRLQHETLCRRTAITYI